MKNKLRNVLAVAGNLKNEAKRSDYEGQWLRLAKGIYPSGYRFPRNDIALITTRGQFAFDNHVKPIPMASRHIEYNMRCLASGYGRLSITQKIISPSLLMAELDIVPTSICSIMHRRYMVRFVCTTSKLRDTAQGDSGGPLVCKNTGDTNDMGHGILAGVVSGHRVGVGSFFTRVKGRVLRRVLAVAGNLKNEANMIDKEGQWISLAKGIYPRNYRFPKADIALITTALPFTFNNDVKPIPMASRHIEYNQKCLTSGYGRLSSTSKILSPILYMAQLDIVPTSICSVLHRKRMIHYVCTTSQLPDTAQGDSGGPLVCKNTGDPEDQGQGILAGVVSGHLVGAGSFFTRVAFKRRLNKAAYAYATFCGGTIISPTKIVSAAHCFHEKGSMFFFSCDFFRDEKQVNSGVLRKVEAVAGNLNNIAKRTDNEGQWRSLAKGVYPKHYSFPTADIALITTMLPFTFDNDVKPIPMASMHIEYNMKCLASGYGRLSIVENIKSAILFMAEMDIVPTSICSLMHWTDMIDAVCTTSVVPDTAVGDSGGPLVCKNTGDPKDDGHGILAGVVSGHRVGIGSFFTRVSSYKAFIEKHSLGTRNTNSIQSVFLTIYVAFCLF